MAEQVRTDPVFQALGMSDGSQGHLLQAPMTFDQMYYMQQFQQSQQEAFLLQQQSQLQQQLQHQFQQGFLHQMQQMQKTQQQQQLQQMPQYQQAQQLDQQPPLAADPAAPQSPDSPAADMPSMAMLAQVAAAAAAVYYPAISAPAEPSSLLLPAVLLSAAASFAAAAAPAPAPVCWSAPLLYASMGSAVVAPAPPAMFWPGSQAPVAAPDAGSAPASWESSSVQMMPPGSRQVSLASQLPPPSTPPRKTAEEQDSQPKFSPAPSSPPIVLQLKLSDIVCGSHSSSPVIQDDADTPAGALRLCMRSEPVIGEVQPNAGALLLQLLKGENIATSEGTEEAASSGADGDKRHRRRGGRGRGGGGVSTPSTVASEEGDDADGGEKWGPARHEAMAPGQELLRQLRAGPCKPTAAPAELRAVRRAKNGEKRAAFG